jgi:formamidopyrimidine-DNA glycosylase
MPEIAECYTIAKKIPKIGLVESVEISEKFHKYINKNKNINSSFLNNAIIEKPFAYGKSIIFPITKENNNYFLISQLGMTGSWFINQSFNRSEKNNHLVIKSGDLKIIYSDPRMFGKMFLYKNLSLDEIIKKHKWGLDPILSNEKQIVELINKKWANKNKSIKALLMEQNVIFGIGNYLASEVLYYSKIHPATIASKLSILDYKNLVKNIKVVINKALKAEGNSFAGGYIHPDGKMGSFLNKIKIYGKEGKKCPKCSDLIKKIEIMGRSSFFCEKCQKKK